MPIDLFALHIEIEMKKERIILLAERHGRTSPVVLRMSQELDVLIVEYQRRTAA
jgi:hypothetical protein